MKSVNSNPTPKFSLTRDEVCENLMGIYDKAADIRWDCPASKAEALYFCYKYWVTEAEKHGVVATDPFPIPLGEFSEF